MLMRERVYAVVSKVFRVPLGTIHDDSSPDTIETWDSLQHLHLILALEEEFGLQFSVDEIAAMQTVRSISAIVGERVAVHG
jgi:acyl carrier protein